MYIYVCLCDVCYYITVTKVEREGLHKPCSLLIVRLCDRLSCVSAVPTDTLVPVLHHSWHYLVACNSSATHTTSDNI